MTIIRRSTKTRQWAVEVPGMTWWRSSTIFVRPIRKRTTSIAAGIPVHAHHWPVIPEDQVPDWVWAALMLEQIG